MKKQKRITITAPIKLDIGCGPNKKEGFVGLDAIAFPGVDCVCDITKDWGGTFKDHKMPNGFELPAYGEWLDETEPDQGWTFKNSSVSEAHCSHVIEHLTNFDNKWERVHFFNELYRVLAPGAKCALVFPHWCSNRYYGDPTHKEPFSEMGFYYLSREWRKSQAPHSDSAHNEWGYDCDFDATWGYSLHQSLQSRNPEYQQNALQFWKEAAQDIIANLVKK